MRRISLDMRRSHDAASTDDIEAILITIEHPVLEKPIRLSTDATERLSEEPEITYGTRSTLMGANPVTDPYLYVLMSADMPSDLEDTPAASTIVLEMVDNKIAELLRSIKTRATVHIALILADNPDQLESEYRDLKLVRHTIDAGEASLMISREAIEDEPHPAGRMSKQRFPGLHK
ncbi:hypothetical protein C8J31_10281 [Rhizobium sp. PP-CC-2G-626]|nr:hypothetical protein C8J31_10281 [Rhizobium sp. PP-CC-2G-626]